MNKLTTVKTASSPNELAVAISYLEDNEIKCHIKNELTAQVYPASGVEGVELQVSGENVERALELLAEGGFIAK